MRLIEESLAMREAIFPNNHPAIAASLYLKGRLLHTTGQHKEAGEFITKSQSAEGGLGSKHPLWRSACGPQQRLRQHWGIRRGQRNRTILTVASAVFP